MIFHSISRKYVLNSTNAVVNWLVKKPMNPHDFPTWAFCLVKASSRVLSNLKLTVYQRKNSKKRKKWIMINNVEIVHFAKTPMNITALNVHLCITTLSFNRYFWYFKCFIYCDDSTVVDDHSFDWPITVICWIILNHPNDLHAFKDNTKYHMFAVQPGRLHTVNIKLTIIRVFAYTIKYNIM